MKCVSDNDWTECNGEQWIGCENYQSGGKRDKVIILKAVSRDTKKDSTLQNIVTAEICSSDDLKEVMATCLVY